ncbi:hypothetical protein [Caulobacter endophyticus]|uniref:hypothetical protein n=1 Tax=Caulobacter endophyticus TaxID=2172652 RepID=UPI00240F9867|nr:hypothetical protein [Caulobacter endophyticus]MDG2528182.1 hypothetical protein [Caulobacter endophyticus]
MFNLFTTRSGRTAPLVLRAAEPVLGDEAFDEHVWCWQFHLSALDAALHRAEAVDRARERVRVQALWDAMDAEETWVILDELDMLNARGVLVDHLFFEQWQASRMDGYVGD